MLKWNVGLNQNFSSLYTHHVVQYEGEATCDLFHTRLSSFLSVGIGATAQPLIFPNKYLKYCLFSPSHLLPQACKILWPGARFLTKKSCVRLKEHKTLAENVSCFCIFLKQLENNKSFHPHWSFFCQSERNIERRSPQSDLIKHALCVQDDTEIRSWSHLS